jgi:hypothetical protein
MCFAVVLFFLQLYILFRSCAIFSAVVLISCMIPSYNFAVVPYFLQLYILFRSCAIFFAVVLIYRIVIVLTNPNRF